MYTYSPHSHSFIWGIFLNFDILFLDTKSLFIHDIKEIQPHIFCPHSLKYGLSDPCKKIVKSDIQLENEPYFRIFY